MNTLICHYPLSATASMSMALQVQEEQNTMSMSPSFSTRPPSDLAAAASQAFSRCHERLGTPLGRKQKLLLRTLLKSGATWLLDIAADPSGLSSLHRLKERGLVSYRRNEPDRRRFAVLTPLGREVARQLSSFRL